MKHRPKGPWKPNPAVTNLTRVVQLKKRQREAVERKERRLSKGLG